MIDYSQGGEQAAILAALPPRGRFLDIGAWDAQDLSNTRALYLLGWGGVLVEPHPGHAQRLRRAYSSTGRVTVVEAAVAAEAGRGLLRATDDCQSTLMDTNWRKWRDEVPYDDEPVEVALVTVEELLTAFGPFDFVSIDAEGASVDAFLTLLQLGYRPRCVCVEYDDRLGDVSRAATSAGYTLVLVTHENVVGVYG